MDRIEEMDGDESEWIARVRRMQRRGSDLPQDRISSLAAYLARALPRRVRKEAVVASPVEIALSEVAVRPVQVWIRTSGRLEKTGPWVLAEVSAQDAARIEIGQRVRAFPLESKSSMHQGKVVRVQDGTVRIELRSQSSARSDYLLEIVTERGRSLSVPNEAILEEAGRALVYVQDRSGDFTPREVTTGLQGELFTEITSGLNAGDQAVTFGSFFIDAEYKTKGGRAQLLTITYGGDSRAARSGDNPVEVSVRSSDDQPVIDAAVTVDYYMPAMPSMNMPEMRDVFTLEHQGEGIYAGTARLSMGGTWLATVSVSRAGQLVGSKQLTLFVTE
jgi:hypothetical protein